MVDPVLQAFQNSLLSISEGSISKTADSAGIKRSVLARLRRGDQLNVTIKTLVKLARAMGKTTDEMLGLSPPSGFARVPTDVGAAPGLSSRDLVKLRKRLSRIGEAAAEVQAMLPGDDQSPRE